MLCTHDVKLRARDVTAHIHHGANGDRHLQGGQGEDGAVMRYASIVFCANPSCERVFEYEVATKEG
jgi:hypothetical protein